MSFVLAQYKNEWKDIKIDNVILIKKEFQKSKQRINLDLMNVDQIVVSDKLKHSDDGFQHFIGYKEGEIVKPFCIILPQMTGYIKYFENEGKNMWPVAGKRTIQFCIFNRVSTFLT